MRKLFTVGALLAASTFGLWQMPAMAHERVVVVYHRHHHHHHYRNGYYYNYYR